MRSSPLEKHLRDRRGPRCLRGLATRDAGVLPVDLRPGHRRRGLRDPVRAQAQRVQGDYDCVVATSQWKMFCWKMF